MEEGRNNQQAEQNSTTQSVTISEACRWVLFANIFGRSFFYPGDGDSKSLRSICNHLPQ
jgi:hypothetical protein